jgi:hypothetical protein
MSEEIKTLLLSFLEWLGPNTYHNGQSLQPHVDGHRIGGAKKIIQLYASQFKPSAPDTEVDKPDFEKMAKIIAEDKIRTGEALKKVKREQLRVARLKYAEAVTIGAEKIWNDHVLPLHSLLKSYDALNSATVEFLENQPNKPYIASSKGSWTTHELAKEIKDKTPVGLDMLKNMVVLSADLILRGKEKVNPLSHEYY